MQLIISNYIKTCPSFDSIEITTVTKEIIEKYDVICIDHYAINENWMAQNKIINYLDIIKNCENVCLLTRDLHEWTFDNNKKLTQDIENKTNKNIIYKPSDEIKSGYVKLKSLTQKFNIKHIISIYDCNEFKNLINFIGCNPYILPLHIDTNIFKKMNTVRDIDILIYGADFYRIYPLRNRIKSIVKTMNIKYHIIDPSARYNTINSGAQLAQLLNRSWLTLCTCSVFDYLVLKYFEASACGSVVIGNMLVQGKNIWEDNYVDIPESSSDDQIKNIIISALHNKNNLTRISDIMLEKITNEYNYDQFTIKLKGICDHIAEK